MKVEVYLFPDYHTIESAVSPRLQAFLAERGVVLEEKRWDGTPKTLPTETPSLIRASVKMSCSVQELYMRCSALGHVVFYDDQLMGHDGIQGAEPLLPAVEAFLDRLRARQQN